jgi:hypothetical protein
MISKQADNNPLTRFGDYNAALSKQGSSGGVLFGMAPVNTIHQKIVKKSCANDKDRFHYS